MKKLFFKASAAVLAIIIICTGCSCSNVVSLVGTGEYSSDSGDSLAVGGNNSENISSDNSLNSSDENSENSGDSSSDDNSHDNSSSADSNSTGNTSSDNSSSNSSTGDTSSVNSSTNTPSSSSTTTNKPSSSSTTANKPSSSSTTTTNKPSSSSTTTNKPSSSSITTNKPSSSSTSNINSGVTFSWKIGNTWEDGGNKCGTAELTIKNNSGSNLNSWKVSFNVPNGFKITSSWEGKYDVNGTKATISNLEYNGSIPSGGSRTTGFNFSCPTTFNPSDKLEFNGSPASASGSGNQGSNNNNNNNPTAPSGTVQQLLKRPDKAKQGDDWLHTDGNKILDKNGKQVWLTGVNWFGYNTGTNTFDGLWNSCMRTSVKGIADHGFNLIRVPISAELLNQWSRGEYPKANYNSALNPEMNDMNSLQIFDYFLKLAEENGIKIMPDIHCAETNAMGHNVNLWYTSKVTVNDYYHALEWLADRYKNNDTIIAIDIKNEPHGKPNEGSNAAIWNNSTASNNWKYVAETAAKKILAKNPNVLIMVEGTEIYSKKNGSYTSTNSTDYYFNWWGGNLRGVRDYPINLGKYQNKLVYSPHDYGPAVYKQPWFFSGYNYNTLIRDCWQDNWLYIHKNNTAPLLIGEWGGFMTEPNLTWMTCMRRLIKEYHLNHTFWCYNANSGDTGGLVLDDFTTWDTQKYNFVKEVLWQEGGKFVGLDHSIPLGVNGITLTAAKGL